MQKEKKDLVCFLEGDKDIGVPVFDVQGNPTRDYEEKYGVSAEEFLYILDDIRNSMKKKPPLFEALMLYYKSICPLSLIDPELDVFFLWEAFSQEYGGYPFDGALTDQPNRLVDAYLTIMVARNEYHKVRDEKMKSKMDAESRKQRNTDALRGLRR